MKKPLLLITLFSLFNSLPAFSSQVERAPFKVLLPSGESVIVHPRDGEVTAEEKLENSEDYYIEVSKVQSVTDLFEAIKEQQEKRALLESSSEMIEETETQAEFVVRGYPTCALESSYCDMIRALKTEYNEAQTPAEKKQLLQSYNDVRNLYKIRTNSSKDYVLLELAIEQGQSSLQTIKKIPHSEKHQRLLKGHIKSATFTFKQLLMK
jgi:hypothetical protein